MSFAKLSLFIVLILNHYSLQAGLFYAAQWTFEDQTVYVYGDEHETHLRRNNPDKKMTEYFYAMLQKLDEKTLVLIENTGDKKFHDHSQDKEIYLNHPLGFLHSIIHLFSQEGCALAPTVRIQNVDPRSEESLFKELLDTHTKIKNHEWQKSYTKLEHQELDYYLQCPIDIVNNLAKKTTDKRAKTIFTNIKNLFIKRRALFYQACLDIGFTKKEYSALCINSIIKNIDKKNRTKNPSCYTKYNKILPLLSYHYNILRDYSCEALDALALNAILLAQKSTRKKVIVIAGDFHIKNIEKHLKTLGYLKIKSVNEKERIRWYKRFTARDNILYKKIMSSGKSGYLFYNDVNIFDDFSTTLEDTINDWPITPSAQKIINLNFDMRKKANQVSLIPFEAIDWPLEDKE